MVAEHLIDEQAMCAGCEVLFDVEDQDYVVIVEGKSYCPNCADKLTETDDEVRGEDIF